MRKVLTGVALVFATLLQYASAADSDLLAALHRFRTPVVIESDVGLNVEATGINNRNVVVGTFSLSSSHPFPGFGAFRWSPRQGFERLATLPNSMFSLARDINDCNVAVGESANHAVRWLAPNEVEDLGLLPQRPGAPQTSQAFAINNLGHIVGFSTSVRGDGEGFFWSEATGMIGIGIGGGFFSFAQDINDHDVVTGALRFNDRQVAIIWTAANGIQELPGLGGNDSAGIAINNRGEVVGVTSLANGEPRGFLWSQRRGLVDLGQFPDGRVFFPQDINEQGDIVGNAVAEQIFRAAVVRRIGNRTVRLYQDTRESFGAGINNRGVFVQNFVLTSFNDMRAEVRRLLPFVLPDFKTLVGERCRAPATP
jgi:probable HAF family extracellular repeat protein